MVSLWNSFTITKPSQLRLKRVFSNDNNKSSINKTTQIIIVVMRVLCTFGTLATQNIPKIIDVVFVNKNAKWNFCAKTKIRVSRLGFLNYVSLYFDQFRTRIRDSYTMCFFISQKIKAHKYTWLKAMDCR